MAVHAVHTQEVATRELLAALAAAEELPTTAAHGHVRTLSLKRVRKQTIIEVKLTNRGNGAYLVCDTNADE